MRNGPERLQIKGRYALAVDDGNAYLAAGLAGLGVLWLPKYMPKDVETRGEWVPLFDSWSLDPMPLYVAYPPNRRIGIKLRVAALRICGNCKCSTRQRRPPLGNLNGDDRDACAARRMIPRLETRCAFERLAKAPV